MALFRQFADELGEEVHVPEDLQNDPVRYEAYVREHFANLSDAQLSARATRVIESNPVLREQYEQRGGRSGLLERMKGLKLTGAPTSPAAPALASTCRASTRTVCATPRWHPIQGGGGFCGAGLGAAPLQ